MGRRALLGEVRPALDLRAVRLVAVRDLAFVGFRTARRSCFTRWRGCARLGTCATLKLGERGTPLTRRLLALERLLPFLLAVAEAFR